MKRSELKETVDLIEKAFRALDFLDHMDFTHYLEHLLGLCVEDERQHRRGAPDGWKFAITVSVGAKLFAVHWIAQVLMRDWPGLRTKKHMEHKLFTVADVIKVRPSALYAQSLAVNYQKEIKQAWLQAGVHGRLILQLADLDYSKLINANEVEEG